METWPVLGCSYELVMIRILPSNTLVAHLRFLHLLMWVVNLRLKRTRHISTSWLVPSLTRRLIRLKMNWTCGFMIHNHDEYRRTDTSVSCHKPRDIFEELKAFPARCSFCSDVTGEEWWWHLHFSKRIWVLISRALLKAFRFWKSQLVSSEQQME